MTTTIYLAAGERPPRLGFCRLAYKRGQAEMPHQDLWARTEEARAARHHLYLAWSADGTAIVATPDRGNVHGQVDTYSSAHVGCWVIDGLEVRGFRGPYANGCYVFTQEAP